MSKVDVVRETAKSLAGTGGGAQMKAVLKGCDAIRQAPGCLDRGNRIIALAALAEALGGADFGEQIEEVLAENVGL